MDEQKANQIGGEPEVTRTAEEAKKDKKLDLTGSVVDINSDAAEKVEQTDAEKAEWKKFTDKQKKDVKDIEDAAPEKEKKREKVDENSLAAELKIAKGKECKDGCRNCDNKENTCSECISTWVLIAKDGRWKCAPKAQCKNLYQGELETKEIEYKDEDKKFKTHTCKDPKGNKCSIFDKNCKKCTDDGMCAENSCIEGYKVADEGTNKGWCI